MGKDDEIKQWILTEFLPHEFEKRGRSLKNVEIKPSSEIGTDHFTSHSFFTDVEYEDQDQKLVKTSLIIKCASQNERFRKLIKSDEQFYNEITFYKDVVPIFDKYLSESTKTSVCELCPQMWFSHYYENHLDKSTLALTNLEPEGFRPTESKTDLDFDHCKLAFIQIAKFHAISYAMKVDDPESFGRLSNLFKEIRIFKDKKQEVDEYYKVSTFYGIDYILEHNTTSIPEDYLLKLKKKCENCFDIFEFSVQPKEPLSVICHGDFLRNNLLYRYENGKPVDLILIDFQTVRYASPFYDLSILIYMNTTYDLRKKHLSKLYKLYHTTMIKRVSDILNKSIEEVSCIYSFELFEEEMRRYSLLGFVAASFFLPTMMMEKPFGATGEDFEEAIINSNTPACERAENMITTISNTTRDRIVGMIQDLYERGVYVD